VWSNKTIVRQGGMNKMTIILFSKIMLKKNQFDQIEEKIDQNNNLDIYIDDINAFIVIRCHQN